MREHMKKSKEGNIGWVRKIYRLQKLGEYMKRRHYKWETCGRKNRGLKDVLCDKPRCNTARPCFLPICFNASC